MANPVLNQKTFAPEKVTSYYGAGAPTRPATMTVDGSIAKSLILLALLIGTATVGWNLLSGPDPDRMVWVLWVGLLVGLGLAIVTVFVPKASPVTAPLYALVEGLVVGAISALYESVYHGIVLWAVICTVAVFGFMLLLFLSRAVRVTERMYRTVILATGAVFIVYGLSLLLSVFGVDVPLVWDNGPLGILFSLVVIGIAAFNLLLDFDLVERGVQAGAPKYMEWYAGFGLLVTLVWLYLEMLRLLGKLQGR